MNYHNIESKKQLGRDYYIGYDNLGRKWRITYFIKSKAAEFYSLRWVASHAPYADNPLEAPANIYGQTLADISQKLER